MCIGPGCEGWQDPFPITAMTRGGRLCCPLHLMVDNCFRQLATLHSGTSAGNMDCASYDTTSKTPSPVMSGQTALFTSQWTLGIGCTHAVRAVVMDDGAIG